MSGVLDLNEQSGYFVIKPDNSEDLIKNIQINKPMKEKIKKIIREIILGEAIKLSISYRNSE